MNSNSKSSATGGRRTRNRRSVLTLKILCFAGSLREESLNKKLALAAADFAIQAGAKVTFVDFRYFPMPLYDQDVEDADGVPENARKFKALLKEHQALLIASPEYNGGYSAVLKNAIDWATRSEPGEKILECFDGKVAALLSASPGNRGGRFGLTPLRLLLNDIRTIVIPEQFSLPAADSAFNNDGSLKEAKYAAAVKAVAEKLVSVAGKLHRA